MEYSDLQKVIQGINAGKKEYSKPVPIGLEKDYIYQFAESISKKYRESLEIKDSNNINLFEFVDYVKGKTHCVSIDDFLKSGSIYVHAKESFDIVLPTFTSPIRDRFTIAHEMGHYYLHSLGGDKKIWADRKGSGQVEWEANWFAASFLMPRYLITKLKIKTEEEMMEEFGVSSDAAKYRLAYKG